MTDAAITQMPTVVESRLRIARPIRAHLAVAGISGAELARRIGLSQPQVSRRLSGRLPFDSDDLTAIAAEINVSVPELIQMPKDQPIGGGGRLYGIGTGIHRSITGVSRLGDVTGL